MTEQPDRAAERIVRSLVAAWNSHDAHGFALCFAEDADFTNVFGMHACGRGAIEAFHAPIFATMFKDSRLRAVETRVRPLRADIAAVDVPWEMTGARDPQGHEWPLRRGLINMIVAHGGDGWSIAVMHNMDLPPEEIAKAQEALQQARH